MLTRQKPQWLEDAMQRIRENYPEDIIDVVYRRVNNVDPPLWKIKCIDCPGKVRFLHLPPLPPSTDLLLFFSFCHFFRQLYNSGPDQTLNNFDLHLKNRGHRAKVATRIASAAQRAHVHEDGGAEA